MSDLQIKPPKLSTGDDATLANYRRLSAQCFGDDSKAVVWLDAKIAAQGADQPVLADEQQFIQVLLAVHKGST